MSKIVNVVEEIMSSNDDLAAQNRTRLDTAHVLGMNIMASPGSGKTSVILQTIEALKDKLRLAVVEGDTAPVSIDADKVILAGMPAVQINTGGSCHLDAVMLRQALPEVPLDDIDLLIVENVGNLICPASFSLGTHFNVVIASVPEGDDKPYKYPKIYRGIDALILNKIDLLPYIDFDVDYFKRGVQILNPNVVFFDVSCKTGEGIAAWAAWLKQRVQAFQTPAN
ncbi:MAG: hydrogenase nickel incorporation protein HypB [Ardenticatenaceae bacterium]|nr:hydrogenase nickel incorporation protein HypB [Ardenticatenaceae bacterium]